MKNEKENYITAGELASLYGIPKQTLLYYDKNELLIPAFVNKNGYRYYSVSQYLILEIILNMRKLNIPVKDIKNYLQNRNLENFEQILREKEQECAKTIAETIEIRNSLQLSLKTIEKIKKTKFEQIELRFQKEKFIFISESLSSEISIRERMKIFSRHNQTAFSKNHFKEFTTGWIIGSDDFFAEKFNNTLQYFTPVANNFSKKYCYTLPEGLYLTVQFQGTYYQEANSICRKIFEFIQRNNLIVRSNIYVFPLKNHWITEDPEDYINQISLQVEYAANHDD